MTLPISSVQGTRNYFENHHIRKGEQDPNHRI
ncbi:unnamed protein product [Spirodela intermedia]|uniref:Uncharacterized protein n=1 Tax=Spirodela intermedia TaxID=51605 RepID=A0A7I8IQW2_SPIIN|nr:unnamed protein product [Spirodela intermedia]CAA6659532.1 unnamed protein product [Spirodela intermedia]